MVSSDVDNDELLGSELLSDLSKLKLFSSPEDLSESGDGFLALFLNLPKAFLR